MDEENKPKTATSPLPTAAKWVLTIIASSLITAAVKDKWDAPRPHVELANFEIAVDPATTASADPDITISSDLQVASENHSYFMDLQPHMKKSLVEEALRKAADSYVEYERAAEVLKKVVALVGTQSALSVETQRINFIETLAEDTSADRAIEIESKEALGSLEGSLAVKYQAHPGDMKTLQVPVTGGAYDLSEVDEMKAKNRVEAHRANLFRRMLIYYEPDIIVRVLSAVDKRLGSVKSEGKAIADRLQSLISGEPRIALTVLVLNHGHDPLALRNFGLLELSVPSVNGKNGATLKVPVSTSNTSSVEIVEGEKATLLRLYSRNTLAEIIRQNATILGGDRWSDKMTIEESRFMYLVKAKDGGLTASVSLVRAGEDPHKARIGPSDPLPVGLATEDMILSSLKG